MVDGVRAATVNVEVADQDQMTFVVTGSPELAGAITAKLAGDTLAVRQTRAASVGNVSVTTTGDGGSSRNVVTIGDQTFVSEGDGVVVVTGSSQEPVTVDITVPRGTPLEFVRFRGDANIGDVDGPLTLDTSGEIRVGKVTDAKIRVERSGEAFIEHVQGRLELEVSGNGEVHIEQGDVAMLEARVTRNGDIRFDGRAAEAVLSATGNGEIVVAEVAKRPQTSVSRNGKIHVGNW
ncbi:MAG: GIN domain-containing protein [Gammaproteobacteria bacterium]